MPPPTHEARTFFIGDVHGCLAELDALLRKLALKSRDRVIFVGDLVAKGPDSAGVVRRVRELGAQSVRGNHDARLLQRLHASDDEKAALKPKQRAVMDSLGPSDIAFLEACPLWLTLPELGVRVVHAGWVEGVPEHAQNPDLVMNMRTLTPEGEPSTRFDGGRPWASLYEGPEFIVFGHDARRKLQRTPHALGLDTGCVYGGELTAYELPSQKLVSVPAEKTYVDG